MVAMLLRANSGTDCNFRMVPLQSIWCGVLLVHVVIGSIGAQSVSQDANTYAIVAPAKLRPNFLYHVSVSIGDVLEEVEVVVNVGGLTEAVSKPVTLHSRETQVVELEIGDWKPGNYSLSVSGHGGLAFHNSTELTYEHKSYSVFIQTDKAVYKPGQLVQFRAVVVDPYLDPSVTGTIDMFVTDAHGNRIHQWNNVPINRGIAAADLLLADSPVLGQWTAHVKVKGQSFSKNFTVAEYSIATFEVQVKLPSYATYNESDVTVTIQATYTYGKPVEGDVTLTVAPRTRYNYLSVRPYVSTQAKRKIDGSVSIPLNLLRDLQLKTDFFEREIEFFALVEEKITGRKYNTTSTMWIYDKDIKVQLIKTSDTFKPGIKYTAFLKVTHQDGAPVVGGDRQLKLNFGYTNVEKDWKPVSYTLPENGIIKLEFNPPHEELKVLYMRAEFRGQLHYIDGIDSAISPSNNFVQVTLLTSNARVGHNVEFQVEATEPLNYLVYQVMGRGSIVVARTIPVPNERTYRFSFRVTNQMAPKARVIVYYSRAINKEVVADAVNFKVEGLFRNSVTVRTSSKEVKPGSKVDIRIETRPNAFVGILATDKSSILLKSGNDISQNDVIKELETFDGGIEHDYWPPWNQRRKKRSIWWLGSTSAGDVFQDSGVKILTDGFVYKFPKDSRFRENVIYIDDQAVNVPVQPPSALPEGPAESERIVLRKIYPDTWLWMNATAGSDGIATISHTVPKDITTTWVISGFSMSSVNGLGISSSAAEVEASSQFYIKMSLPYTVLMGESVAIQVVVFNQNKKSVKAEVTMFNSKGEYEFTIAASKDEEHKKKAQRSKFVTIPPQVGLPVSFLITPKKIGHIEIKVVATTQWASDTVTKKLHVKPEGRTQYFNKAILIDLANPSADPIKANVSVPIPHNAIEGSERISVSAVGDLLGLSINNANDILRIPTGCGEQNMLTFMANTVLMNYLQKSNRVMPSFTEKAVQLLRFGYQRELTYKRQDGSFSTFGEKDKAGSVWLTALVTKLFHQARLYIDIDENVHEKAVQWLIERQKADGSFEETGEIHHKALQGNSIALTAFVLISLLENEVQGRHTREVELAEQFLSNEFFSVNDPYVLNIVTYALYLSNNLNRDAAFQKMVSLSQKADDMMYWANSDEKPNATDRQSDYFYLNNSLDIEATAYALLVYAKRSDVVGGMPILKWLISSQNENGGFASTQDSMVALQALAEMSTRIVSTNTGVNVKYNYADDRRKSIRITDQNRLQLQRIDLPTDAQYVEVEASGIGTGVAQVSWTFNLAVSGETPAFFLNALLDKTSTQSYLQLSICTRYKEGTSNMVVMEVGLPSGYVADTDALPSILQIPKVKKVEANQGDTNVVIYYDRMTIEESCVTVPAHRTHKVAHQRPAPVHIYDYYYLVKSARMFYHPHKATLCEICDGDDCGEDCSKEEKQDYSKLQGDDNGATVLSFSGMLIIGLVVLNTISYNRF